MHRPKMCIIIIAEDYYKHSIRFLYETFNFKRMDNIY